MLFVTLPFNNIKNNLKNQLFYIKNINKLKAHLNACAMTSQIDNLKRFCKVFYKSHHALQSFFI